MSRAARDVIPTPRFESTSIFEADKSQNENHRVSSEGDKFL
jgi:hypothetical protein